MANEQAISTQNAAAKVFNDKVQNALNNRRDMLADLLPKHLTAERMIQLTMMAIYRTPDLMKCDPATVVASVITAAELGLELSGVRGEGYLIPRWNSKSNSVECQFQPGYRGLLKLANNSGDLKSIHAYVVYENDHFQFELGIDVTVVHRPALTERGTPIAAYCAGRNVSGEAFAEVMSASEIDAIRERSKAKSGPWITDTDEMWRKTVLKRKLKTLPNSSEKLHRAIELDNSEFEFSKDADVRQVRQLSVAETLALPAAVVTGEPPTSEPDSKPKGKAKAANLDDSGLTAKRKLVREYINRMGDDGQAWLEEHSMTWASIDTLTADEIVAILER